jgi:hypothetical protein
MYRFTYLKGGGPQWSYQSNVNPEELFRQIFGEFSRGFGQSRGSNPFEEFFNFEFRGGVQATCHVTFLQAARGATKEIEVLEMGGSVRLERIGFFREVFFLGCCFVCPPSFEWTWLSN